MMRHRYTALLAAFLGFGAGGGRGGDDGAATERTVLRDSAGVRIVESAAPQWSETEAWRLADAPSLEIRGDGPVADEVPLDPASIFRLGDHIIVADGISVGHDALLVYEENGRFVRRVGRDGEGPCEFGQLWWAQPYRADSIVAFDYADHTVAIFDVDGGCAREVRLPVTQPPIERGTYAFSAGADGAFGDGSLLAQPFGYFDVSGGPGPAWYRHAFLRVTPDGTAYDSLGLFEINQAYWTGSRTGEYPYAAVAPRAVDDDGFWFGTGDTFEIRRYDADGTLRLIVRRAFEPTPVTAEDRNRYIAGYVEMIRHASYGHGGDEAAERARLRMQEAEFAQLRPAYSKFLQDAAGHLWVQEHRNHLWLEMGLGEEPVVWSVFDADGRWLGEVELPGRFQPESIGEDEVLGVWKDDDGIAHVRAYGLIK